MAPGVPFSPSTLNLESKDARTKGKF
jgi:hypothetical protein